MVAAFRDGFGEILKDFRESKLGVDEKIVEELDRAGDAFTKLRSKFTAATAPEIAGLLKLVNDVTGAATKAGTDGFLAKLILGPSADISKLLELYAKRGGPAKSTEAPPRGALGMSAEEIKEMEKELTGKFGLPGGEIEGADEGTGESETGGERNERLAREKREREEARREREESRLGRNRPDQFEVNSLQRIGGFIGSVAASQELASLDVARKSENHLAAIRKAVENGWNTRVERDVQF